MALSWLESEMRCDESDEGRWAERARTRAELAALRFETALVRYELKFRADQAREPAGQPTGGRFAKEGGAPGVARTPTSRGFLAPSAAAAAARTVVGAATRAAPLAGAGELAAAAAPAAAVGLLGEKLGEMGASQVIGRFSRGPNGPGGLTPFFHLELPSLTPQMPALTMLRDTGAGREPVPKGQFDDECDAQYERDMVTCNTYEALYGRGPREKADIGRTCRTDAAFRLAECMQGVPEHERRQLYTGQRSAPSDRSPHGRDHPYPSDGSGAKRSNRGKRTRQ